MIQDIRPHFFSNKYAITKEIQKNEHVFHFKENTLLLKRSGKKIVIPLKKDLKECSSDGIFLFTLNNVKCFLVSDCEASDEEVFSYYEINFLRTLDQKEIDWAGVVAFQLVNWYSQNKFCGKCGSPTELKKDERAIVCPSCLNLLFPKISPAIIVAILCKDKILLARGVNFKEDFYSLVAGYVDVGESIEDAVRREVIEEVGLTLKNIRYYKSQPWPFSGSVMIGFIAEADDLQSIQIDDNEIVEAAWYARSNLPNYPTDRSIAGEIIDKFKKGDL